MAGNYDELPAYGYRSDARIAANAPYGTYPGKRAHTTRLLDASAGGGDADGATAAPLLRSTTNAYETHWQPPANPAMTFTLLETAGGGDATPQSLRRSSRADSPQRGILRRRADSPAARPNLFDCPSASTLALAAAGGSGGSAKNVSAARGAGLANELRKLSASERRDAPPGSLSKAGAAPTATRRRRPGRCRYCAEVLRAAGVECVALTLLTLVHFQARLTLGAALPLPQRPWEAPLVVSLVDAAAAAAIYAALPATHLSPLVTIAHAFSSLVPLGVCAAVAAAQLASVLLTSTLFFFYLEHDSRLVIRAPALHSPDHNGISTSDVLARSARQLVLSGALAGALLVLGHLCASRDVWRRRRPVGAATVGGASLAGTFASVWLNGFLSLSHSNVSWNVAFACVAAAVNSARAASAAPAQPGNVVWTEATAAPWHNQHLFWFGPMIGALLAGVLYRLAFAPESTRKVQDFAAERKSNDAAVAVTDPGDRRCCRC